MEENVCKYGGVESVQLSTGMNMHAEKYFGLTA